MYFYNEPNKEGNGRSNSSEAVFQIKVLCFLSLFLFKEKKYFVYVPYQQGSNQLNDTTK